jgi:hypothetical protein
VRERPVWKSDVKPALDNGKIRPQKGGEYLLVWEDEATDRTVKIPLAYDENAREWVAKTGFIND